ncbi:lactoylglutathione lyase [Pusillimonas sp. T7-7]|uniref:VOC family protein n=1 Tax=Pusillimonas sp. (strain T7-7) TaxID=1007105 RepID=UPI000208531C|nr:glyoxalase/bleomycin resistance/extradiol dioxygenase family protein [Pusillimonas sp. T7-7]AEC21331.1 lactoylglutathione lyase [Pusillimonas sp. T7-7]
MTLEMTSPLEVGIACRDLPRLRHFYEQVLGFTFISEYQVPADKSAESGLSAGGYTVVRLQTSNGERVKLLAPATPVPAQEPAAFILDKPNAVYLTFIIEDINAAIARLLQEGTAFMTGDKRVEVRPGVYLAFCRDPEGNVLELVQYEDISSYRTDLQQRNA